MKKPDYCTLKSVPNCWECSLTNYGLDCKNRSISAREMGSKGGSKGGRSTSDAKKLASKENGKKGGRPRKDKP